MKYSKEERFEIGRRIYDGELTRNEAAEEYGISVETARNYAYYYRDVDNLPNMRQAHRLGLRQTAEQLTSAMTANATQTTAEPELTGLLGTEEYEAMSRDELIRELIRIRVNEARLKKGYEVKGVGAARRFVPIGSRSIR